jgi:ABC-type lipoprotein release transport system permease subunit
MCLRNLWRRRVRTALCICGVALATVFIVAVGTTITNYTMIVRGMNVFFRGNIVVVAEGALIVQAFPVIGGNIPASLLEQVQQVPGVQTAVPMLVRFGYQVDAVIQLAPANVSIGIPAGNWSLLVEHTPLKPGGTWPSANPTSNEVVVGQSLARQYDLAVGSIVRIEGTNMTVTGVLDTQSALLSRALLLPLDVARRLYYPDPKVSWVGNMIVVKLDDNATEQDVTHQIQAAVLGVEALTTDERNELVEPLLRDIETWNLGLSSVLYVLSLILVAMVALINVSERRRDFATLTALGAPQHTIVRMVLTETTLIGVFGGLIGIVVGAAAAVAIASLYTAIPLAMFLQDLFNLMTALFILRILALTVVVSCVAGLIPAAAASKTNPAELMRAEY